MADKIKNIFKKSESSCEFDKDIAEQYGCSCCGGGYLVWVEGEVIKWFAKTSELIDYMKSIGKFKEKKSK